MTAAPITITAGWSSNTDVPGIAERLAGARNIAVLTHIKPDGDAIGSTLALARTLGRLGARATPVYAGPMPPWTDAVVGDTPVLLAPEEGWDPAPLGETDAIVILDTGSWPQLEPFRAWLAPRRGIACIIDHHPTGDDGCAELRCIIPAAAAVCEPVAELCTVMLGLGSPAGLPPDIATPLHLGIATDTGWFRYPNTTARTLRLAADLIDAGVDHNALYRMVDQSDGVPRLLLMGRALASVELHDDNRIALMTITQRDLAETGATVADASGFTDPPQQVRSVRVVAVLVETDPGRTKVSLRSKDDDDAVDVAAIARQLGGGGHTRAAGVRTDMGLEQTRRRLLELLGDAAP